MQLLNEGTGLTGQGKPHPYLATRLLVRANVKCEDIYYASDLMHQYPNILALGILLIEIAVKRPLTGEECSHPLSERVIHDYYTWAWKTAHRSSLKDTVHSLLPTTNQTETISQQDISNKPIIASESPLQADFTVAIFCALPLEVDAVTVLFDGFYKDSTLYQNAPGDSNTYTLGRMGRHHAVLVHLPGMGKSAASQAASSIRSSYPNIRLALVVGICGGVPYKKGHAEILLDIVVSDGIVQHDFGRRVPGAFLRKTSVTDVLANGTVRYPGVEQDELFQPTYQHKHHDPIACSSCAHSTNSTVCDEVFDLSCRQLNCDKDKLVQRKRLQTALTLGHTPSPTIHVGLIASGDTVMKSGQDRDLIAIQDNVIAFEMEGAGVWDSLPCLVVKGVCDYADSHKNKLWQPHAAATGAACMKALLDEWTLQHNENTLVHVCEHNDA
ncbi:nucleoside phosphorylase domain-containing protein [Aspergillus arachidicola]|nr:nucleoside phosphorylase domain-containing protein [Aspergillus arachidicola]